jgi:hypothetical protein
MIFAYDYNNYSNTTYVTKVLFLMVHRHESLSSFLYNTHISSEVRDTLTNFMGTAPFEKSHKKFSIVYET